MKRYLYFLLLSLSVSAYAQNGDGVVINEFLASSDSLSGIADPSGSYADWIEIYNNNTSLVDMAGFFLSDDYTEVDKMIFPVGTQIEADGYLIVWADKDLNEEGLHADFKLKKEGEQIILLNTELEVLDSITYGEQETNVSMARIPNGTGPFVQRAPTFAYNNDDGPVSVSQLASIELHAYPNPAQDQLFVAWPEELPAPQQWLMVNAVGRTYTIAASDLTGARFQLDVQALPAGYYYLWIKSNSVYLTKKILIQR